VEWTNDWFHSYDSWGPSPYAWDWWASTSMDAWNSYWSSAFDYSSGDYPADAGATVLPPIEVASSSDEGLRGSFWDATPTPDASAQSLDDIFFNGTPIGDLNNDSSRFSQPTFTSTELNPNTDWGNVSWFGDLGAAFIATGPSFLRGGWLESALVFTSNLASQLGADVAQQATWEQSYALPLNDPKSFQAFDQGYGYPDPATADYSMYYYSPSYSD
jgi:hypothetical protein